MIHGWSVLKASAAKCQSIPPIKPWSILERYSIDTSSIDPQSIPNQHPSWHLTDSQLKVSQESSYFQCLVPCPWVGDRAGDQCSPSVPILGHSCCCGQDVCNSVDTQLTINQLLIKCWSSVMKFKILVNRSIDRELTEDQLACQSRCQLSVDLGYQHDPDT